MKKCGEYQYLKRAAVKISLLGKEYFVNECDQWKGRNLGLNVVSFFANNLASQPDPV